MKYNRLFFIILALAIIQILNSCYPNRAEFIDELDVVVTDYDPDFFTSFTGMTYYMPDSIVRITDPDNPKNPALSPEQDAQILANIESQLEALGYVRLDEETTQEESDLIVMVSANSTTTTTIWWPGWSWWPGWGTWPPYWGPGWGWGGVSTTTTASLVIRMVDPNAADEIEMEIPVVWLGAINGLLQGSSQSILFRANNGVDQMFLQSPYLDIN